MTGMKRFIFLGLAAALSSACSPEPLPAENAATRETKAGMVEITQFRLAPGVAADDFAQAASSMQSLFLEKQHGYLTRTLTVSADSLWTDIVYWENQQQAERAMQQAEQSDLVLPFMEKIDVNTVRMSFTTPIPTKQ